MGYVFQLDRSDCLNCGVCMDVCPVHALDMTRRVTSSIESGSEAAAGAKPWMMEFPIQTGTCIGCELCATECPTKVIRISVGPATELAPAQGPVFRSPTEDGWVPLSAYTRESLKDEHTDPWGTLHEWSAVKRDQTWRTWRSWSAPEDTRIAAPCQEACPVGTNAGLYVSLLAEGRYTEALAVAAEHNPFPSVCGRVCTAPCEIACRRGVLDEPIAIRELKRFASDHGAAGYPTPPPPASRREERVAIVGAGPTGLGAAYMLVRSGYRVTVFDAMPVAGGMMAVGIPEYRLPKSILQAEIDRIVRLGVELKLGTALGRDITLDDLRAQGFTAILIATGASKSQRIGIPGESADGVWPATYFLKQVNLGEQVRLDGEVIVVGGGSTAMDAARTAIRVGAQHVRVLYRRTREDMTAQHEELRAAEHEGITIDTLVTPVEVLRKNGWMTGVRCVRLRVTGRDAEGRSTVQPVDGSEFVLDASALMVAVGEAPDPSILPKGSSIQVAEWGGVVVDAERLATAQPGVFAAGDVATGPRSVIEGVAQGQRAAWAIDRYLRGLPEVDYVPPWKLAPALTRTAAVSVDVEETSRAVVALTDGGGASVGFAEVSLGYDEAAARGEALRCLRCDVVTSCPAVDMIRRRSA